MHLLVVPEREDSLARGVRLAHEQYALLRNLRHRHGRRSIYSRSVLFNAVGKAKALSGATWLAKNNFLSPFNLRSIDNDLID